MLVRALIIVGIIVVAGTVWAAGSAERSAADQAASAQESGQLLLTSMLDQETGLRGYLLSRREEFLQPYYNGRVSFNSALRRARAAHPDDAALGSRLGRAVKIARAWQATAEQAIAQSRNRDRGVASVSQMRSRKQTMDAYRRAIGAYQDQLRERRRQAAQRTTNLLVALVLGLSLLFGGVAWALTTFERRRDQRARDEEERFQARQDRFLEVLQVTHSEGEAHSILKRHLEISLPGTDVTVLNRNNSDNRLEPTTELSRDSVLAERLIDARPESCLAVRFARPHAEMAGDDEALVQCEICGKAGRSVLCTPSLVGGEVIGSVLVVDGEEFSERDRRQVTESVAQAAPVLANLRNLAIAESRAATDALTGLSNARALQERVKALVAQSSRSLRPLAAISFDLDHFKQINDSFGHEKGNDVLAAVGDLLCSSVRGEDEIAGRAGGEEFLVLLPDTGREAALASAERLRAQVAALQVPGLARQVTGSFGVAILPENGLTDVELLRAADRALYRAKELGRNRVELASEAGAEHGKPAAETES